MTRSTSGGSASPPAAMNCGYARRIVVMAPRSAAKRSSAVSAKPCWWRIHADVACSRGESPRTLCAYSTSRSASAYIRAPTSALMMSPVGSTPAIVATGVAAPMRASTGASLSPSGCSAARRP